MRYLPHPHHPPNTKQQQQETNKKIPMSLITLTENIQFDCLCNLSGRDVFGSRQNRKRKLYFLLIFLSETSPPHLMAEKMTPLIQTGTTPLSVGSIALSVS